MHSELATYLETRVGVKLKIESLGSSKRWEDDMEIGAFGKGGKGKGESKGKGGKSEGKEDKGKGKGKSMSKNGKGSHGKSGSNSAAVVRFNCGKPGHIQRDCRAAKQNNSNSNKGKGKGRNKGKNKSVNNVEENNQQTEREAETRYLGLAMLGATSEDERPAEGEQPVPDVGLPEATRKAAQRRYRRQLKAGTRLTWRDLPVTRYRQRLAASIDAARTVKGSVAVGQWIAKKVLEREYLDDACSSGDERSKPSTVAAMEYATKRAQAKRMSSGAYDVLREETERSPMMSKIPESRKMKKSKSKVKAQERKRKNQKKKTSRSSRRMKTKVKKPTTKVQMRMTNVKKSTSEPMQRLQRMRKAERKSWEFLQRQERCWMKVRCRR